MFGKTKKLVCLCGFILLLSSARPAQGADYRATRIEGPPPIMAPVPHLPTKYLHVDDRLGPGSEFLMLAATTITLVNPETGEKITIDGPNRVRIDTHRINAYDASRITISKP